MLYVTWKYKYYVQFTGSDNNIIHKTMSCGEFQFLTLLIINNINIVLETQIILKCFPVFLTKDLIVKDHCFDLLKLNDVLCVNF